MYEYVYIYIYIMFVCIYIDIVFTGDPVKNIEKQGWNQLDCGKCHGKG